MLELILFVLYLLAYAAGIGAFTAGLLLYFGSGKKFVVLKYYLCANLFSTINMFFYTLYYYGDLVHLKQYQWFWLFFVYGSLFSFLETGRWLSLTVSEIVAREMGNWQKKCYLILVVCAISTLTLVNILKNNGILSDILAVDAYFFVLNLYCAVIVVYNCIVLWKNRDKLSGDIKTLVGAVSTAVTIWQIVVLLSDLVQFGSDVQIIISSLPILYFVVNAIAIFYIIKHYFWNKSKLKILAASKQAASPNYELFCRTYSITDREMQVILLVADGMSNQAIGATLYISLNTVRNHIYNAYKKIGIKSRYELISILNSV